MLATSTLPGHNYHHFCSISYGLDTCCQVETRGCPSPKLAQLLAALSPSTPGATYPSAYPSILKNIKEKERCVLLSTPAAARAACEPLPSESKRSQHSCSSSPTRAKLLACSAQQLPGLRAAQLSPSHSLPPLLPLLLSYEKLSIGRAALHARNVTRPGPELHEE